MVSKTPKPSGIALVIYKEITDADRKKVRKKSNDSPTGGGARDFRFSPYPSFKAVFEAMFPARRKVSRKRGSTKISIDVRVGEFSWTDPQTGNTASLEAIFETPTDPRPNEGRVTKVPQYLPLQVLPPSNERSVVIFVMHDDGSVWPEYVTVAALQSGAWHASIAKPILACLNAKRAANVDPRGYIDFRVTPTKLYCNGK